MDNDTLAVREAQKKLNQEVFALIHAFELETKFSVKAIEMHTADRIDRTTPYTERISTRIIQKSPVDGVMVTTSIDDSDLGRRW